jgi:hypothetical protein
MVIDGISRITAEISALETMACTLDPNMIDDDFGYGLGMLFSHIRRELLDLEKEAEEERHERK